MALTEFGKAVRKARIDINQTLATMAKALGTTPAFLSAMETGTKKVSDKWVKAISRFFEQQNVQVENLTDLAKAANEVVPLDGLSHQQKMLVAGFAKSQLNPSELKQFAELLEMININSKHAEDENV